MGVRTAQGFNFKLVANGVQLDLFQDETITISDNITGLFDVGTLPTDFSRNITLPGSKKNNEFFEQYYDISVENPFLFSTSNKVDAYFDFDGLYLASGYLQLNRVNVVANKYVDSYEVTIFGSLASFAREINRSFLTDITTLDSLNHSASFQNITGSWTGGLFDGDIVYPLIDYGQDIAYSSAIVGTRPGIDEADGSLSVQDFKPAIRVKKVWDAIFEQFGFTYQSDFLTSSLFDNLYMSLHNGGKHPEFDGIDLETYGKVKIAPISGSDADSQVLVNGDWTKLGPWENNEYDPQGFIGDGMSYVMNDRQSPLRGKINLKFKSSGSLGVPQFQFGLFETGSVNSGSQADLNASSGSYWQESIIPWNDYLRQEWSVTNGQGDVEYELEWYWSTAGSIPANRAVYPMIRYDDFGGSNFTVTLSPDGDETSYFEVTSQVIAADFRVMDIADQMPVGESGIKMIDFIQAVQKKFNLIIYPSKTKPKEFIVETFNNWYKQGEVKDFNKYINLDEKLEVVPANNLAVNKLKFGHSADNDLLSQNFKKEANRPYGESFFIDTQNFFSQGEFKVEPADAASPLRYVQGTGLSGSVTLPTLYPLVYQRTTSTYPYNLCDLAPRFGFTDNPLAEIDEGYYVYTDSTGTPLTGNYTYVANPSSGDIYNINSSTGLVGAYETNCSDGEPTN
jgi:hypothetical protein